MPFRHCRLAIAAASPSLPPRPRCRLILALTTVDSLSQLRGRLASVRGDWAVKVRDHVASWYGLAGLAADEAGVKASNLLRTKAYYKRLDGGGAYAHEAFGRLFAKIFDSHSNKVQFAPYISDESPSVPPVITKPMLALMATLLRYGLETIEEKGKAKPEERHFKSDRYAGYYDKFMKDLEDIPAKKLGDRSAAIVCQARKLSPGGVDEELDKAVWSSPVKAT